MRSRRWSLTRGMIGAAVLLAGCGGDGSDGVVPSSEQLAASLITPSDLSGGWEVWVPPDAPELAAGVVADDEHEMLPRIEFCGRASGDARQAAAELRWMAFRQLDLDVGDPIAPPADPTGRVVFLQEFLTSASPERVESTFDLLRAGTAACAGEVPAGEEGSGEAVLIELPELGDDRFGSLTTIEEAGGGAMWRIHSVVVRDGAVLMSISVVDISAGDLTEPLLTSADVEGYVRAAFDRLP